MTDFDTLVAEYGSIGVGPALYALFRNTVRAVILGRGYPTSYSPTERWDDDALSGLAHDWVVDKLLACGHLDHLLLANTNIHGLRRGLELSFVDYLLSQRTKTASDHLFRRANQLLESHTAPATAEPVFRLLQDAPQKTLRVWGLVGMEATEPYQGSEYGLIAAGFRVADIEVIRYRDSARKLSPVVSNENLLRFLHDLFEHVGRPLTLGQMMVVLRYRFDLLAAPPLSLDAPLDVADGATLGGILPAPHDVAAAAELHAAAAEVLQALTPRQQQILLAYAQPNATLDSVAARFRCSRGTVDNEVRRALRTIRERAVTADEALVVYRYVLESLGVPDEE